MISEIETTATYVDGETGYECPRCKHVFGNEEPGYVPTCSIDDCNDNISENNQGVADLILHTKLTFPDLTQAMPARELVILGADDYAKEFLQGSDYRKTFSNEDILIAASFITQYQESEKKWLDNVKKLK